MHVYCTQMSLSYNHCLSLFSLFLSGTLLHFDDYGLRDLYFLDPQWLAKLMARLISPSSAENMSLIDGKK